MVALVIGATLLFAAAARAEREVPYTVEARLLGGLMRFEMQGTLVERVDPGARRYAVRASGRGSGIESLLDSSGILHENRWVPEATVLHVSVWGRISRTELQHDVRARLVRYRSRGESFFLRQLRRTDDTLTLEPGLHIDDLGSAYVNYAERRWAPDAGGVFRTHLVRRSDNPRPGPDGGVAYRAELRPLVIEPSRADGEARATALIDITGFSSWALATRPARVVFGADRRPERIDFRLRYGTTVAIRFAPHAMPSSPLDTPRARVTAAAKWRTYEDDQQSRSHVGRLRRSDDASGVPALNAAIPAGYAAWRSRISRRRCPTRPAVTPHLPWFVRARDVRAYHDASRTGRPTRATAEERTMIARDVMTTRVVAVAPESAVRDVARLLMERRISAVPVVDAGNRLVGIVSEGDLMLRPEVGAAPRRSWWLSLFGASEAAQAAEFTKRHGLQARDVMTKQVVTVSDDTPLGEIARLLEVRRIKRVPVVRDGALVGIVSRADLLRALASAPTPRAAASDQAIREALLGVLHRESWAPHVEVNVIVRDGVVHLWGLVDSDEQRRALLVAAQRTDGVRAVEDHLGTVPPYLRGT